MSEHLFGSQPGLAMPAATGFVRLRAGRKASGYNPDATAPDWTHPDELAFAGFLASSSSAETRDANDNTVVSTAVLTVADPTADIQLADRIRTQPDDGRRWEVNGFPSRDTNPFTGWAPSLEIELREVRG